jgi:hypothetical protein
LIVSLENKNVNPETEFMQKKLADFSNIFSAKNGAIHQ